MVTTNNKRGFSSLMLVFFVFIIFFAVLFLGVLAYSVGIFQDFFSSIDFNIGDTSFNATYNITMATALDTIIDRSDNAGMVLIFGMIIVMLLVGYAFSTNRLWMVFDLFAIVVSFAIAVYLSRTFDTFIHSNADFLEVYSTTMQTSSTFMLNLPFVIVVVGALIMIVTYGILRKKEEFSQFR